MSQILAKTDEEILRELNSDYVNSFLQGDAKRYDEILAADFVAIEPSGQLVSRAEFIEAAMSPATYVEWFHVEDVQVRLFGDCAQIYARTPYKMKDGREGVNCYIDTYLKRDGEWKAISGHVTKVVL
jgi:ketosteroid isomerase-like protein